MLTMMLATIAATMPLPAEAPCTRPAAPPPALAGWDRRTPVRAGVDAAYAPALATGRAVDASLAPTPRVTFATTPEKPGDAASHGGLLAFDAARAGRYRVALGGPAWIDLVRDGRGLASAAHGHGPACSGVRKMVDFDLVPGRYVLQLSGAPAATLAVMVARLR